MKKLLALLLTLALVLTFAACSNKNEPPKPENDPVQEEIPSTQDLPSFTFTQYGNAKITVVGAEFAQDDYDEDFLRVYYDYTNTSDTAIGAYPSEALDYGTVTQDGEECEVFTLSDMDDCAVAEDLSYNCGVLPGCTARHTMLIRCDPDGGIVEIPCYIMIGDWIYNEDEIEYFTIQIDPEDMMGAPAPLVIPTITNPEYAVGLPTSGSSDYPVGHEISINGWEVTTGYEGENVLRVKLTITNNNEEDELTPMAIQQVEAYQDGFALVWLSAWDLEEYTDADEAFREDLYPGETVECNALFLLRNDSPVEVVAEQFNDELRVGIVCDVKAAMEGMEADKESQQQAANAANAEAVKALVGVWDRTDGWEDHLTFNADGTGIHDMTGDEFDFNFQLDGNTLYIYYDDGEEAEYTYEVDGDDLVLEDIFEDEQLFVRAGATASTDTEETEEPEEETQEELSLAEFLIGTWQEQVTDYGETFTFNEDGTGLYCFYEDEPCEFAFTYEVCEDDSVDIFFEDGDQGGFWIEIIGEDTIVITNSATDGLELIRQ